MFESLSQWLAASAVSRFLAGVGWFVPAVQTVHILGIAVVFTMLAMLDLRLLRLTKAGPTASDMVQSRGPWIWSALVLLLVTGVLLVIVEPERELLSNIFRIKMLLVLALAVLTWIVQIALSKDSEYWNVSAARRRLGGVLGLSGLSLCVAIIAAGRLIAYF